MATSGDKTAPPSSSSTSALPSTSTSAVNAHSMTTRKRKGDAQLVSLPEAKRVRKAPAAADGGEATAPLPSAAAATTSTAPKAAVPRHRAVRGGQDRKPPPFKAPAGAQDVQADLVAFGLGPEAVRAALGKPEPEIDSLAQLPGDRAARKAAAAAAAIRRFQQARERRRAGERSASGGNGDGNKGGDAGRRHQYFQVDGRSESNWVLFEPAKGFPPTLVAPTPGIFERYAVYRPGNTLLVEVNLVSDAVRLRRVPALFAGKTIEYQRSGPKLVDVGAAA